MKQQRFIAIVIIAVAVAAVAVILLGIPWGWRTAPAGSGNTVAVNGVPAKGSGNAAAAPVAAQLAVAENLPSGPVTYRIAQAATKLPGFVQATIDPLSVKVGQVQHFTVITNDPNPVTSVVATIVTDHKTVTVNLASQGQPAISMITPRDFIIEKNGTLALAPKGTVTDGIAVASGAEGGNIAEAADINTTEFTGSWTVEDTHTADYKTTFTATDAKGNVNSVTLTWADPTVCPFATGTGYTTGNVPMSSSCEMSSGVDGPEHGNLSISAGTLQIDSNATLVINSGYNISLPASGGTIAIASNGKILLGDDMCGTDADGDGYISQSAWTAASACGALTSRASIASPKGFSDCDDGDANAHPGQIGYYTAASAGDGTWDYNCDGSITAQSSIAPTNPGIGQYYYITGYCYTDEYTQQQNCYSNEQDCDNASAQDMYSGGCSAQGNLTSAYQTWMYGSGGATADVRFCAASQGQTQCTPWLSQGGGWSDWAPVGGSKDALGPSVSIQTTTLAAGMAITGITHGVQLDENNNMTDVGTSCTAYEETAPVGTTTNPSYGTTYCDGTSLSTTPDQFRVYLSGSEVSISSNPSAICPSVGGCH